MVIDEEKIHGALRYLMADLPDEKEMNKVSETILSLEQALRRVCFGSTNHYASIEIEDWFLGYDFRGKRIVAYQTHEIKSKPLIECKFPIRQKLASYLPELLFKLKESI